MWSVTFDLENRSRSKVNVIYLLHYLCFHSAKKKLRLITYWKTLTIPLNMLKKSLNPLHYLWALTFYEFIDILRTILVISLLRKPLTLHAWKSLYDKTRISWKHCTFVLRVRWPIRELLPLKLDILYSKI
jgi:hypothetical protein